MSEQPSGTIAQIIRASSELLTKPWKGIILLIAIPLIALGVFAWKEQSLIEKILAERYLDTAPQIDETKLDEASATLLRYSALVIVYRVILEDNLQRVIHAQTIEGTVADLENLTVPFIPVGAADLAVAELAGATVCWDIRDRNPAGLSEHHVWLLDHGFVYICSKKIPTNRHHVVGLVHMAWPEKPSRAIEVSARTALGATVDTMLK